MAGEGNQDMITTAMTMHQETNLTTTDMKTIVIIQGKTIGTTMMAGFKKGEVIRVEIAGEITLGEMTDSSGITTIIRTFIRVVTGSSRVADLHMIIKNIHANQR